ncbi:Transposase DDE domain-containing protein [Paracoccus halophilus]|uniref:Transposase DDE domain-containing protein n=1 Tax=Paracoccus halophilus TaxID=376733 RepID=A0A1I0TTG8_9RHOB|nr:Transposase DDE domain-containing protein [Paracoccus halophilus]
MIPMRKNRKVRKVVDMTIHTLRNMVERCCNKLKNSRRLATRYDQTADSFLGFVDIACVRLWLRHLSA